MYYGNRKFNKLRKDIREELIQMGWIEVPAGSLVDGHIDIDSKYNSPHPGGAFQWIESRIKDINIGSEAYYACEIRTTDVEHLCWRCDQENPRNHHPLDTFDAFEMFRTMLLDGIPFDYHDRNPRHKGIVRLVDWEHPERNYFEFAVRWKGALNDRFGWDFVLCVNAMPVAAIVVEADQPEDQYPGESALNLVQYQLDKDFQFPCYCHSTILSNGKQFFKGGPFCEADELEKIDSLREVLEPAFFLIHCLKEMEY